MKNLFLFLLVMISIASCSDEYDGLTVEEYIAENNLNTTELAEGVHIVIHEPGDSNKPNVNSNVVVSYTGTLPNGDEFDSSERSTFNLGGLIRGWQIGLVEIGIGGSCTLIIPPSAGYGNDKRDGIPRNSPLVFEMALLDIVF